MHEKLQMNDHATLISRNKKRMLAHSWLGYLVHCMSTSAINYGRFSIFRHWCISLKKAIWLKINKWTKALWWLKKKKWNKGNELHEQWVGKIQNKQIIQTVPHMLKLSITQIWPAQGFNNIIIKKYNYKIKVTYQVFNRGNQRHEARAEQAQIPQLECGSDRVLLLRLPWVTNERRWRATARSDWFQLTESPPTLGEIRYHKRARVRVYQTESLLLFFIYSLHDHVIWNSFRAKIHIENEGI